jgi:glyoxylase-like metal-dependent hydrolase (beta-lactamase superfamily II)
MMTGQRGRPSRSISMAFPAAPRYARCYVLEGEDGAVHLVDCGPDSDENWRRLRADLASRGDSVDDIASVTVTHAHFDHGGMAARIRAASGARVRIHSADLDLLTQGRNYGGPDPTGLLRGWGVPVDRLGELLAVAGSTVPAGAGLVEDDAEPLADGEDLGIVGRRVSVLHTPGHTPGSLVLIDADEGVAYLGDHVLPDENPGVGLGGSVEGNAIEDYLASLDRLQAQGIPSGLAGHGNPILDLDTRIDEIRGHHLRRGREVATAERSGRTVWEVAQQVGWSRGWGALSGVRLFSALNQVAQHRARNASRAEGRS